MPIKILALDDSKTMRMAIKVTFAAEDADVTSAGRSAEFFEKAKSQKPDVILLDYRLDSGDPAPKEICSQIRAESGLAEVPVILMMPARELSSDDSLGEQKMREVGADAVIGKPFLTQELIDLVWKSAKSKGASKAEDRAPAPAAAKPAAKPAASPAAASPVAVATSKPAAAPKKPAVPRPAASRPAAAPRSPAPAAASSVRLMDRNRQAGGASGMPASSRPAAASTAAARATASAPSASPQSMDIPIAIPIPFVSADAPPPKMLERIEAAAKKGEAMGTELSPETLKALAQLSHEVVERIAWEIMPDLAESIVKERNAP